MRALLMGALVAGLIVSSAPAVQAAVSAPGPVRALRVVSVDASSVTLSWLAPLKTSVTVTAYRVDQRTVGGDWTKVTDTITPGTAGAVMSYSVTGLTKGTAYQLRVRAIASGALGVPVMSGVAQMSAGATSVCVVRASGAVQCVGQNGSGQLGNGTTTNSPAPVDVRGISNAVQVSVGTEHACAVVATSLTSAVGSVKCWGNNTYGQLGNGSTTRSVTPVSAGSRTDYVSVAAGDSHTCALTSGGAVYCWGDGSVGQLGRGSVTSSTTPVLASTVSGVAAIGAGSMFTCAVLATGGLKCWGDNGAGQFGNGSIADAVLSAVSTVGISTAVAVSGGDSHMCVLVASGDASCFGTVLIGDTDVSLGGRVVLTNAIGLDAGESHACAVTASSSRWCWGGLTGVQSATAVKLNDDVALFDEGNGFGCNVSVDGVASCGGSLPSDSIDLTSWSAGTYTPVGTPDPPTGLSVTGAPTSSEVGLSWASPSTSETGGAPIIDYLIDFSTDSGATWTIFDDGISSATSVTVSGLTKGTSYVFRVRGVNSKGTGAGATVSAQTVRTIGSSTVPGPVRLLSGTATTTTLTLTWNPPAFVGGSDVIDYTIEYSSGNGTWTKYGVTTNTTAVVTGIGGGTALSYRVSARNTEGVGVAAVWGFTDIAAGGFHTCVRTASARVQCWGDNTVGQLGVGSSALTSSTPLQISSLSNVVEIAAGTAHSCATTTTGSVYCWGENQSGQIGDGTQIVRRAPVLVSNVLVDSTSTYLEDRGVFRDVIATGGNHTCAVTSTGGVKCWGEDGDGQVTRRTPSATDPDIVAVTAPTTVTGPNGSALAGVVSVAAGVAHSCALFSTGRVWCWGNNDSGQTDVPSGLANVSRILAAGDHTCALRSDGGVACWGGGVSSDDAQTLARITDATNVSVSIGGECVVSSNGVITCLGDDSLGQLGSTLTLPTSTAVVAGSSHTCALTTTGAVQCWGDNTFAQLGSALVPNGTISTVSSLSPSLVTLTTPPMSPTSLAVTATRASEVDISWSAPSNGGSPITDYVIETQRSDDPSASWIVVDDGVSTTTSATLTLVQGVDYSVRVSAKNVFGAGTTSSTIVARAYTVPSAPGSFSVSAGDGILNFVWATPDLDGGSPITRYEVSLASGQSCTTTSTSCTITGLFNGTTYAASVRARNAAGLGTASTVTGTPRSVPSAVTGVVATGGDRSVTLRWSAPSTDGGSSITDYQVSRDGGAWQSLGNVLSTSSSGLTNGVSYSYRVRAVNALGAGSSSIAATVVPMVVDGAPTITSVVPGDGRVSLTWLPGTLGGGSFLRYEIVNSAGATVCSVATTTCTVTGLTNGVPVSFGVRTVTSAGTSNTVSASATPRTTPGSVNNLQIVGGDGLVTLSWAAPSSDGGASLIRYEVSSDGGTLWLGVGLVLSTTVTGLTNGTAYSFQVRAVNVAGAGIASAAVAAVPRGVATAPTLTSFSPLDGAVQLQWSAPTSLGGGTVSTYKVSRDGGAFVDVGLVTSFQATGLTNGVSYSFRVRAVTQVGDGAISAPVSVTPYTVPASPTLQTPVSGDQQVSLRWSSPASDGGSALTSYEVLNPLTGTWSDVGLVTAYDVTGLVNATQYSFSVRAVNAAGSGTSATPVLATPQSVPGVPTMNAPTLGDASVTLKWTTPSGVDVTTLIRYEYQRSVGTTVSDSATWTAVGLVNQVVVTGLTNGTTYAFRVRAVTSYANGAASDTVTAVPRTVPSAPTLTSAVPGNGSVSLTWTQPSNGGAPITEYQYRIGTSGAWTSAGKGTTYTVSGLTNGVSYNFRVRGRNEAGTGYISTAISATPRTVPDAVVFAAPTEGDGSVTWTWSAPAFNGGASITGYVYKVDEGTWSALTTSRTVTRTGLSNGIASTLTVKAVNAAGESVAVSQVATPKAADSAPTLNDAVPSDASVSLSWDAGLSGGGVLDHYEVSVDGAEWTNVGNTTSATISALDTGAPLLNGTTYAFRVRSVSLVGGVPTASSASQSRSATPRTIPDSPANVSTVAVDAAIEVTWTPPSDTGGSAITGYEVSSDDGATWRSAGGSDVRVVVISSLDNGQSYSVRVRAVNVVGSGRASSKVVETPRTVPSAPTIDAVISRDAILSVSWTPGDDGGSAVTSYEYSIDDDDFVSVGLVTSVDIPQLTNGRSYSIRVRAVNGAGEGDSSLAASGIPASVPAAPTAVSVIPDDSTLVVRWAPGFDGGSAITSYEFSTDGKSWASAGTATSVTVSSLVNGRSQSVYVRAVNDFGVGESLAMVGTPRTVPAAPVIESVDNGNGNSRLSWSLADDGGNRVLRYEYDINQNGRAIATGTGLYATIAGLDNGSTYVVRVRAVNDAGAGSWSTPETLAPRAIPGAPAITVLRRGDGSLHAEWTVVDDGGSAVTEYQYSVDGGPWTTTKGDPNTDLSGLDNGRTYVIQVRAKNSAGWGTPSLADAFTPATAPGVVAVQSVTAGDGTLLVQWSAPEDTGGAEIIGYEYAVVLRGDPEWSRGAATDTAATITGLTNGSEYKVYVRALNEVGPGSSNDPESATPYTSPGAPTVRVTLVGDQRVEVEWDEPRSDGGTSILGYEYSTDGGTTWASAGGADSRTLSISQLTNGNLYDVKVRARNIAGGGDSSQSSRVIPFTSPASPGGMTIAGGDGLLTIEWTDVDNGGRDITGYEYSFDDGKSWTAVSIDDTTEVGARRRYIIADVQNGVSYSVRLRAVNEAGVGDATAADSATPLGAPDAPVAFAQTAKDSAVLTWATPTFDGGSDVVDYEIQIAEWVDSEKYQWRSVATGVTAQTFTVTSLSSDTTYVFRVAARNAVGRGHWSNVVDATPLGVASAPTNLAISRLARQLLVSWDPPQSTSGLDVLSYEYRVCDGAGSSCGGWTTATSPALVTGLDDSTAYLVQVRAVTQIGAGGAAAVAEQTLSLPGTPTNLGLELDSGALTVSASWSAVAVAAGESPILGYRVTASPTTGGGAALVCETQIPKGGGVVPTQCTLNGLTLGTTYGVTVVANNGVGEGSPLRGTVEVVRRPDAPSSFTAVAGDRTVRLSWAPPASDGGAPILGYDYSLNGGVTWTPVGKTSSVTVPGLTNGTTYPVRTRAVNKVGASLASDPVSVRPLPPMPSFASTPKVYGPTVVGGTLTCDVGTLSPSLTYSYTWKRGTAVLSGATGRTYVAKSSDLGQVLSCGVVASNVAGIRPGSASAGSAVLRVGSTASRRPSISPTSGVKSGTLLTCARGTWTASPTEFVVRFVLNGTTTLAQGVSATYRVTSVSSGGRISCEVFAMNRTTKYGGFSSSSTIAVS